MERLGQLAVKSERKGAPVVKKGATALLPEYMPTTIHSEWRGWTPKKKQLSATKSNTGMNFDPTV